MRSQPSTSSLEPYPPRIKRRHPLRDRLAFSARAPSRTPRLAPACALRPSSSTYLAMVHRPHVGRRHGDPPAGTSRIVHGSRFNIAAASKGPKHLAAKNHFVAMVGEYVGTCLFMIFALGGTKCVGRSPPPPASSLLESSSLTSSPPTASPTSLRRASPAAPRPGRTAPPRRRPTPRTVRRRLPFSPQRLATLR